MIHYLLMTLLLSTVLFGINNVKPKFFFKTTGAVQSIVLENEKLYAGTTNGTVEVFDLKTQSKIQTIKIPDIKDFMGDIIPSKIYSIDILKEKLLIVSQGMKGYRNLFIYENEKLDKVLGIDKKMFIKKAKFVSSESILIGLLSNRVGLFDIINKKQVYLKQVSQSSFSDFMLNEDKSKFATTDESGRVRVLNVADGVQINEPKALNLDKVYQLDFKNDLILTAGQDRKAVVYNKQLSYSLNFDFLLYSCALSPEAERGAVAYNEENKILIFDIKTQEYLYNLSAQEATLTQILFINKNELYISSESKTINYYKLH